MFLGVFWKHTRNATRLAKMGTHYQFPANHFENGSPILAEPFYYTPLIYYSLSKGFILGGKKYAR